MKFRAVDVMMSVALLLVLGVLIVPVPTPLLDIMLVASIGLGMLVLVLTTQIRNPLELSAFPALLLMLTLYRLSLNVASTRQILLNGFAGQVIQSFGDFVVGGNFMVGVVVFLILTVINFMVITKGSGRIAEVAARFTLDAMPGKQMSVDADLNAGLIDEKEAIKRRENLRREADFYGAMDGASKFVRGDAVAGLIITVVNILGGLIIGMVQQDMTLGEALRLYTILTVGDGLISQIPALVVSTAAGMLVTRAASDDTLGGEVSKQLFMAPKPMLTVGTIMTLIGLVPGLPLIPFVLLGALFGGTGLVMRRLTMAPPAGAGVDAKTGAAEGTAKPGTAATPAPASHQIPAVSPMDLEIGFGLVPLVDRKQGGTLIERIGVVRNQIAEDLGFMLPPINVRDNIRLKNNEYGIKVRGLDVAHGGVRLGFLMAINPTGDIQLDGYSKTREPAFGFDAYWIPEDRKAFAESKNMTVVDCASVITTHLAETAKRHAADILTRQDVHEMVEQVKIQHASVVQELIPVKLTVGGVHRVLCNLLKERVSIRNLALILETIADHVGKTQEPLLLGEFCRRALGGHIAADHLLPDGTLPAIGLHPDLEAMLRRSMPKETLELATFSLEPGLARAIVANIRTAGEPFLKKGMSPVLLCAPLVRPALRHLIQHDCPELTVMSFVEVPDATKITMVGMASSPVEAGLELNRIAELQPA